MEDQIELDWRKSSYSGNGGGDCVEISASLPGVIAVRDSKNPCGPLLMFTRDNWASFTTRLRATS